MARPLGREGRGNTGHSGRGTVMVIQFLCPGCGQPIEVDDEWSSRLVACPYCRKSVMAPSTSTLEAAPQPPMASPLSSPPGASVAEGEAYGQRSVVQMNPFATWALGLSLLALVALIGLNVYVAGQVLRLVGPEPTPQEIQQVLMEQMQAGDPPAWLMAFLAGMVGAFVVWLAALLLSILALTRLPVRRGASIAALVICGVPPLWMCLGVMAGF